MRVPGLLLLLALAGGCGLEANRLYGSVKEAYSDLPFQHVDVLRQEYGGQVVAYHVIYTDDKGQIPVKVTANAPVEEGVAKDLMNKGGSLTREVVNASQFPDMLRGNILFEHLGDVGSLASGNFHITFQASPSKGLETEGTLNGDFSATLQKQ
jgi:hypothetical protein